MAVAHDVSATGAGNGVNALALSAMTTGGTNRGVLFIIHFSSTSTVSSITGGATATKVGSTVTLAGNGQIEMWSCLETATITSQVYTVNTSGFPQLTCVASAYSGIDSSSTTAWIGATNTNNSGGATNIAASVTTTRANSLVTAGGGSTTSLTITAGTTGQTLNATPPTTSSFSTAAMERQNSVTAISGTAVSSDLNLSGSGAIGIFAVEVKAPAAASIFPRLMMMGMGA